MSRAGSTTRPPRPASISILPGAGPTTTAMAMSIQSTAGFGRSAARITTTVMRGSDRGESFAGLSGNDFIDGRGGHDRVRYDTGGRTITVEADLEAGKAIGVWEDGSAFTHRLVSIEELRGSQGNDVLLGDSGNNGIRGRSGNDEIWGRGGDDNLRGEQGDDVFVFGRGHGEDYIADFSDGEDLIMFVGLNLNSKDDVLNNAHAWTDGVGVWIDLRPFGGGTLSLGGLPRTRFDGSDFVF